jgi:hypothetical protein
VSRPVPFILTGAVTPAFQVEMTKGEGKESIETMESNGALCAAIVTVHKHNAGEIEGSARGGFFELFS